MVSHGAILAQGTGDGFGQSAIDTAFRDVATRVRNEDQEDEAATDKLNPGGARLRLRTRESPSSTLQRSDGRLFYDLVRAQSSGSPVRAVSVAANLRTGEFAGGRITHPAGNPRRSFAGDRRLGHEPGGRA